VFICLCMRCDCAVCVFDSFLLSFVVSALFVSLLLSLVRVYSSLIDSLCAVTVLCVYVVLYLL